ncbi:MAG: ATP-binding protein [Anaerolineales bacterium]|nr:ATP-binding protein [Anaerolineales bacterium]
MTHKRFSANYANLAKIGSFIKNSAIKAGLSTRDVYTLQVAVDEACANIIDHAYGGEDLGSIDISCSQVEDGVEIIIKDEGNPFDPDSHPDPDFTKPLEELPSRGAGLMMMRKCMDNLDYSFSPEGNTLILYKKISK